MVSLRPLLRFSRALGRQVFPVDGSGRQTDRMRQAQRWAAGQGASGPGPSPGCPPYLSGEDTGSFYLPLVMLRKSHKIMGTEML